MQRKNLKRLISYIILILCIPAVILLGNFVFKDKQYAFISLAVALLSCVPFFLYFEQREQNTTRLILIAVMTALSVAGRLLFSVLPGFKPVTAMVIITAMYFGSEAGFMTGALTAVISNFYFGQGPWTSFQMFTWGLIGLLAGLMSEQLKKARLCFLHLVHLQEYFFHCLWIYGRYFGGTILLIFLAMLLLLFLLLDIRFYMLYLM